MKKLILLIPILLLSLSSFSQTDTTKVRINNPIARLVIKDLITGDGCAEELKLTQDKVIKLEAREGQKDTIISLLKDKDKNNQFIISTQTEQLQLSKELSENGNSVADAWCTFKSRWRARASMPSDKSTP